MPLKRKEYRRDERAEKAAKLYLFCARDPDESLKVPAAMMARGYTPEEAANRALQMQVRRLAEKIALGDTARPSEARTAPGAEAPPLKATKRLPLVQLDPNAPPVDAAVAGASSIVFFGGVNVPSPQIKTKKTSHQIQVERTNKRKQADVNNLAHVRATTLVAAERLLPKGEGRTTQQVIDQVIAEFRLRNMRVSLSKSTINEYVARGMIGQFPIARGYQGLLPPHAFSLLVLATESKIQIDQVNSGSPERNELIRAINRCCGIVDSEGGRPKETLFERVMRKTSVRLNVAVSPPVEERRLRWTTYANLLMWFKNFRAFLLEKGFAREGGEGEEELVFEESQLRRIINVDETEISLDGSKTNSGGRRPISFYNPNLPMASRSVVCLYIISIFINGIECHIIIIIKPARRN